MWEAQEDILTFKDKPLIDCNKQFTKRSFLNKLATLFDHLGFFSSIIIQGKILLQEIWLSRIDWDEPSWYQHNRKIVEWQKDLTRLSTMQLPRCLHMSEESDEITYVFNDASEKGLWKCIPTNCLQILIYINLVGAIKITGGSITNYDHPKIGIVKCILGVKIS